ncbi:MAG: hypothetical protein GF350_15330 [Chitinivibrionales bacterium]|nr:hypothetical protein [Chitinivibrionales bacterium]
MDSNAYKYFIEKSQRDIAADFPYLPKHFATVSSGHSSSERDAIALFVGDLCAADSNDSPWHIPYTLRNRQTVFFARLFHELHLDILQHLQNPESKTPVNAMRNGRSVIQLLSGFAHHTILHFIPGSDSAGLAMAVFLIEACMYYGACPNAWEGHAKQAAHTYFRHFKKSLFQASASQTATSFCYIRSAWFFARRTEGIRVREIPENSDVFREKLIFAITGASGEGWLFRRLKNRLFFIIFRKSGKAISAGSRCSHESRTGLSFAIERHPVGIIEITESRRIERPEGAGIVEQYICGKNDSPALNWTIAIFSFRATIYRLDIINPLNDAPCLVTDPTLRFPSPQQVDEIEPNRYLAEGVENTVIEIPKNPWDFRPSGLYQPGIVEFRPPTARIHAKSRIEILSAYAQGKNFRTIDITRLTGVFDEGTR